MSGSEIDQVSSGEEDIGPAQKRSSRQKVLPSMLKDVDILTLDTLCDPSSEYMHVERPV